MLCPLNAAGIPTETLNGSSTAVLSATFTEDYIRMAAMDPDNVERMAATGTLASVIPNRVSYFFGLHGPSIHVDTACSSALSAFDMACKVLKSGDAEAVSRPLSLCLAINCYRTHVVSCANCISKMQHPALPMYHQNRTR